MNEQENWITPKVDWPATIGHFLGKLSNAIVWGIGVYTVITWIV